VSSRLLQFSPKPSTRIIRIVAIPQQWCAPSPYAEIGFFKLWFEEDDNTVTNCVNWGAISGLALSFTLSGAFWTGLALIVERVWK
jgi:hypothetical protein